MGSTISLLPSEILYSQDSILCYFDAKGAHSYKKIGETLDDICEGRCSVDDIPRIRVAKECNRWVTADNRRLWVFKHLERLGKCRHIKADVIDSIKPGRLNSTTGGKSVWVRGGAPGGYWYNRKPGSNGFRIFATLLAGFAFYFLCVRKPPYRPTNLRHLRVKDILQFLASQIRFSLRMLSEISLSVYYLKMS